MLARTIRIVLWSFSIAAIVGFLVLAIVRIVGAPPAGPIEHVVMTHAARLAAGQPLYRETGAAIALPVMPGLPALMAMLSILFGDGLWVLRLVAMLSALAVAGIVWLVVRAETKSVLFGAVSAGLMMAGLCGLSLRAGVPCVVPLALGIGLAALALLRFGAGLLSYLSAGVLVVLASFVHPLGLASFAAGLAYLIRHHPKHALGFVIVAGVLGGTAYVSMSEWFGAWFNFNAWEGPVSLVRFRPLHLLHAIGNELLGRMGVLTFSTVLAFALPTRPWRGPTGLWMWSAGASIGLALFATQNLRVSPAEMFPALVALSILGPISAQRVTQHLAAWPGSSRLGGQTVVMAALALQFVMMLAGVTSALLPPGA